MSFEICLVCYHAGNAAGVPRGEIHELFDAHVSVGSEPDWWDLVYERETTCSICLTPMDGNSDLIHVIVVSRPCEDRRLWQSLFSIMSKNNVLLWSPGDGPPLIARAVGH